MKPFIFYFIGLIAVQIAVIVLPNILGYKKVKNAGFYVGIIFNIFVSIFFASASFYLIIFAIQNYFFPNASNLIQSHHQLWPIGQLDGISNDSLIGVIALLVSFAGLLAYIFKKMIYGELTNELYKMAKQERMAAKSSALASEIGALMYSFLYFHKDNLASDRLLAQKAVDIAEMALKSTTGLDMNEPDYKKLRFTCENNLVFTMAVLGSVLDKNGNEEKFKKIKTCALFTGEALVNKTEKDHENDHGAYNFYFVARATKAIAMAVFSDGDENKMKLANELKEILINDDMVSEDVNLKEEFLYNWNFITTKLNNRK
jgi:hypothetical protein